MISYINVLWRPDARAAFWTKFGQNVALRTSQFFVGGDKLCSKCGYNFLTNSGYNLLVRGADIGLQIRPGLDLESRLDFGVKSSILFGVKTSSGIRNTYALVLDKI